MRFNGSAVNFFRGCMRQGNPLPNKLSTKHGWIRTRALPNVSGISAHLPETNANRCCNSHPMEVAGSLQARDMIPIAKGLIIWFLYNQHLSRSIIESDVLVGYQSIVDLEEKAINALSGFISSNINEINCRPDSIESILSRKVQPDWKRSNKEFSHNFLPEIEWQEIAKTCNEIYQKISSSGFKVSQLQSSFANTPEAILRGCAVLGWQKMPAIPEDLTSKLQAAQFEIDKLKNSRSWKMTAPLRWLVDIAKNSK